MPKNPLRILKNTSKSKEKRGKDYIKKTDYEQFGRYMSEVYETGYFNKKRMYKYAFIKGVVSGFGGVIGATIVVALALWLLSFLDSVPLINNFVDKIEDSTNSSQQL